MNLAEHEAQPGANIACGELVEVGLVETDGDIQAIRGDNRWLWLASGGGLYGLATS